MAFEQGIDGAGAEYESLLGAQAGAGGAQAGAAGAEQAGAAGAAYDFFCRSRSIPSKATAGSICKLLGFLSNPRGSGLASGVGTARVPTIKTTREKKTVMVFILLGEGYYLNVKSKLTPLAASKLLY